MTILSPCMIEGSSSCLIESIILKNISLILSSKTSHGDINYCKESILVSQPTLIFFNMLFNGIFSLCHLCSFMPNNLLIKFHTQFSLKSLSFYNSTLSVSFSDGIFPLSMDALWANYKDLNNETIMSPILLAIVFMTLCNS
jgi:hypothetical protein